MGDPLSVQDNAQWAMGLMSTGTGTGTVGRTPGCSHPNHDGVDFYFLDGI